MRPLRKDEVTFSLEILPEHIDPAGCFDSGDDEQDREMVQSIIDRLNAGHDDAWCCLKVTASWTSSSGRTYTGTDYLGGVACGPGYSAEECVEYHDMQSEALAKLNEDLTRMVSETHDLEKELAA